jgi:membrane-bound lytic murein transglycosylase D
VPFPIALNRTVQGYVDAYLNQPQGLKQSVRRSSPYLAEMVSLLQERGLPPELVYLSFAESEFSYDGAGPWQLSRTTARRYGLLVNGWVDERRDPIKSTRAAADYLTELREQNGCDWRMTLVAWNNGENGVDRYMRLCDAPYDHLVRRLPRRTRALLNRFMALALIARNHSREFGLPGDEAGLPRYRTVIASAGTSFQTIALREHTSVETIGLLNPALFRQCVPPDAAAYPVRLPLESNAAQQLPSNS